jgi:hypothetical protein
MLAVVLALKGAGERLDGPVAGVVHAAVVAIVIGVGKTTE